MTTSTGAIAPLGIGRSGPIAAAGLALRLYRTVGLVQQHDPTTETPTGKQLYHVGTEAKTLRHVTAPDCPPHARIEQREGTAAEFCFLA